MTRREALLTARQAVAPLSRGDVVLAWLALAVAGLDLGEIVRRAGRRA